MKNLLLVYLFFLLNGQGYSFEKNTWPLEFKSNLPAKFFQKKIFEKGPNDIKKDFGKPNEIQSNKYFYELNRYKYGLIFTFDSKTKKVNFVSYKFTHSSKKPNIKKLKLNFKNLVKNHTFLIYKDKFGEIEFDPVTKLVHRIGLKK